MKPTVAVVGAGVAGLGAALLLARRGAHVDLYERSPHAGGLLEPVEFLGVAYDRGSHRVHEDAHPLLIELTRATGWALTPRRGVLVLGDRHLAYPPAPIAFARALGLRDGAALALGWLRSPARLHPWTLTHEDDHDEGFEDFVRARAGDAAYERFYRPYAEKVWGLAAHEVSRTVARQRLSTSSPLAALMGAMIPRARRFLYPRHGMASLIEHLHAECLRAGVSVHLSRSFDALSPPHTPVIYTGHLGALADAPALTHRGLYLLHLALPRGSLDATDTWYTPESRFWFGRVSQPARFSAALTDTRHDVLCVEIPEGRWGPSRDFLADLATVSAQLRDAKITPRGARVLDARQTFVPCVYPLYRRGWVRDWRAALERVRAMKTVFPAGRQGLFLHCNLDHALHVAAEAVDHVLAGGDSSAWIDRAPSWLGLRVRD